MQTYVIHWPEDLAKLQELHSGDMVRLNGVLYTARDAAHRRMVDLLDRGESLPFDLRNSAIYYACLLYTSLPTIANSRPEYLPTGKIAGKRIHYP